VTVSTERLTVAVSEQIENSPLLIPAQTLAVLKGLLQSGNVKITLVFEPLGRLAKLETDCINAMRERLNDPTVEVTVDKAWRICHLCFVRLSLSRPQ